MIFAEILEETTEEKHRVVKRIAPDADGLSHSGYLF